VRGHEAHKEKLLHRHGALLRKVKRRYGMGQLYIPRSSTGNNDEEYRSSFARQGSDDAPANNNNNSSSGSVSVGDSKQLTWQVATLQAKIAQLEDELRASTRGSAGSSLGKRRRTFNERVANLLKIIQDQEDQIQAAADFRKRFMEAQSQTIRNAMMDHDHFIHGNTNDINATTVRDNNNNNPHNNNNNNGALSANRSVVSPIIVSASASSSSSPSLGIPSINDHSTVAPPSSSTVASVVSSGSNKVAIPTSTLPSNRSPHTAASIAGNGALSSSSSTGTGRASPATSSVTGASTPLPTAPLDPSHPTSLTPFLEGEGTFHIHFIYTLS
jgi:hypothetical protein